MLRPGDDHRLSLIGAVNSNLAGRCGQRAIFRRLCRELVQQQREVGDNRSRNLNVATSNRKSATLTPQRGGRVRRSPR
jgi:hypothetical protein